MDHTKILKRAFDITRYYRVLWIFGILLALTTAGGGGGNGGGGRSNGNSGSFIPPARFFSSPEMSLPRHFDLPSIQLPQEMSNSLIAGCIVLGIVILLLIVAGVIVRYVSEAALIRMADDYETTQEKVSFRQGFRLGWSRSAWRIFLIDLLIGVTVLLAIIVLLAVAGLPSLLWLTDSQAAGMAGTMVTVGLAMLLSVPVVILIIALSLLLHFFRRACVLENLGVMESIRRGLALVRQRVWDILIMGVLLLGVRLAWFVLMIPIILLLAVIGFMVAGAPAAIAAGIASLFAQGETPWIVAAFVGVPVLILIVAVPGAFLSGLMEVFKSSSWTLTYRELLALDQARVEPPAPDIAAAPAVG